LRQSLAAARYTLDSQGELVDSWPTWTGPGQTGSLSDESIPPMSEWTLIKPDEFPSMFDDLLARTLGGNPVARQEHRDASRLETICGTFLEDQINASPANAAQLLPLRLINMENEWWPGVAVVRDSHKPPTIAAFSTGLGVEIIQARAERWLRQSGSPFSRVIQDSLRSYTAPVGGQNAPNVTDQDYDQRRQAFKEAFEAAISASKPLVGLDDQLMAYLFGNSQHPRLAVEVSSVPFKDHPLYQSIHERLSAELAKLPGLQDATDYFTLDPRSNHVDIVTSLYGAYPVLVIESLLKPIAQAWNSLTDAAGREAFWDKRRARRLTEFIPAPQEHILCMLRGWFLGHALGLVHRSERSHPWSVAPRGNHMGRFAKELPTLNLSTSPAWGDQPALILESLGIAYVEVGRQNNLEPLLGYVNLLELGKEGDGQSMALSTYSTCADYVSQWIRTGKVKTHDEFTPVRGPRLKSDLPQSTSEERLDALIAHLEERRARYKKDFSVYETRARESVDRLGRSPLWPSLYEPIKAALTQIIDVLESMRDRTGIDYSDDDDE